MKEKNKEAIDEQYLISMMAKEEPAPAIPPASRQEETEAEEKKTETVFSRNNRDGAEGRKKKKQPTGDYEELFLKGSEETARYGKTIYIRKEFHERIQRICQVIGENQVSLYSYIDNVLLHHFESYKEEIRDGYERKQKPII